MDLTALDRQIIHFIICTNSTFYSINHPTFHSLFSSNHSLQKIKDEKHYREWVLPRVYERVKKAISEEIKKYEFLSFTTDIWSSSTTNKSFLRFFYFQK